MKLFKTRLKFLCIPYWRKKSYSCDETIFSRTLDRKGNLEMGQWDQDFFFFLNSGSTTVWLKWARTQLCTRQVWTSDRIVDPTVWKISFSQNDNYCPKHTGEAWLPFSINLLQEPPLPVFSSQTPVGNVKFPPTVSANIGRRWCTFKSVFFQHKANI